jgi:RHS repeat-associated protein
MMLTKLRRRGGPIAATTLTCFALSLVNASAAWAQQASERPSAVQAADPVLPLSSSQATDQEALSTNGAPDEVVTEPDDVEVDGDEETEAVETTAPPNASAQRAVPDPKLPGASEPLALPTGADRSGVTNKVISVPKGSGTVEGMGESFSAQLSTGIATFSVPFSLPAGRGVQPSLGLSYSSSAGAGVAGMGWQIGAPFIARQTDRGAPKYQDHPGWHAEQDRFVFNGGQELVPICVVGAGLSCPRALQNVSTPSGAVNEAMPAWATGWQYFRPRVEGSFLRFFWSPGHLTWRVQDRSGSSMELGVPLDGSNDMNALERNPDRPSEIYRWHLVRQYDSHGQVNAAAGNPQPVNVVVYKYLQDAGAAYLSDIFDTTPASTPTTTDTSKYAHHTRLRYETRTDPTTSYRSGWRIEQRLRLAQVDVASKIFNEGLAGPRRLVRRYHLEYDADRHVSLLTKVQVEGRCTNTEQSQPEEADGTIKPTSCDRLPPMAFGYSRVAPFKSSGEPAISTLAGYEGFDERVRKLANSPPHSLDEQLTDLIDFDADALPDVVVTAPGQYGSDHGLFRNNAGSADSFLDAEPVCIEGVLGATSSDITLKNLNLTPLDLDGDATVDLLHMPKVRTYSVYSPQKTTRGWCWQGRTVDTASGQSPKINLGKDATETRVFDVNYDGLVDVVVSTGTEFQTFLSLGRFAGGDGQFGDGKWVSETQTQISNDPITSCVPWSGSPVRFGDPDVKLGDMNGDGITDIVRLRKGDVRYWPGRGNGFWGTGKRDDCAAGKFGDERHLTMASSPQYSDIQGSSLRLDDVNGDGLSDLVQVRFNEIDIWLNVDGVGWTERHIIGGTPASPGYANRVRLVDVNGSGTPDILWGDAEDYRYIDLQGGGRPSLLTRIENGLGKSTDIEYSTSVAEMLAAETETVSDDDRGPWAKRMPITVHVVKRVTDRDNLERIGRNAGVYVTEYSYRDPVYEGRQREFRGFTKARSRRLTDDKNSLDELTKTTFILGECVDVNPSPAVDTCDNEHRYLDNTRDALKGLPIVTERKDQIGKYLSTTHTTYTLQHLYTGLDGRAVRHAFESATDQYLYDHADWVAAPTTVSDLPDVVVLGSGEPSETRPFTLRSSTGRVRISSASIVDAFGNKTRAVASGCVEGCIPADEVIQTFTDPARIAEDDSGWIWRTVRSYVNGSAHSGDRNLTRTTFNSAGDPLETFVTLTGTMLLDRTNAAGFTGAPAPPEASTDGEFRSVQRVYDTIGLGTVVREVGTNGACADVNYDEEFEQFPISETISVGGAPPFTTGTCGPDSLATGAAYDRAFGKPTVVIDPNTQSTLIRYDEHGRLNRIARPNPDGSLPDLDSPSTIVTYLLAHRNGKPFSVVHGRTEDGLALGGFLETWTFVDGLGRSLATVTESEIENRWIVSDFTVYDGKGLSKNKHLPYFWTGALSENTQTQSVSGGPPLGTASGDPPFGTPPVLSTTQIYDAFDRERRKLDLDTTVILESKYHALSTDLYDAADRQSGPHQGTFATERKDGHGRTVETIERINVGTTPESRSVLTQYLPTGEPEVITRKRGSDQVVRWMRYDSLGRMVLNVEPNTSAFFEPNPGVVLPPVSSGGPHVTGDMFDVAYGAGVFVAVGVFGSVWRSPSGGGWTHSGEGGHLYGVTYCNNHFTLVGTGGGMARSTDGTSWTSVSSGVSSILWDVACDPSNFNEVAVGVNGKITASTNGGLSWTVQTSNVTSHLNAVAAASGTRIAVGDGGVILRSTNGTTWSPVTSGTTAPLLGVVRGGDRWIAVGPGGTVLRSTDDGASWSPTCASCASVAGTIQGEGAALTEVVYLAQTGRFLAAAGGGKIWYSDDGGTSWTKVINDSSGTGSTHYYGIAIGGSTIVVVGLNGRATSSTDAGISWTDTSATALRAWRYVYSYSGQLVGTSDARGCGVNFMYDAGGRLLGEDYSPCEVDQAAYSAPDVAAGTGLEVYYQYDDAALPAGSGLEAPPDVGSDGDPGYAPGFSAGRLVSIHDRASSRWSKYDARGRVILNAVRVARPDPPANGFAGRFAPRWYYKSVAYDVADREIHATTGARVTDLLGTTVTGVGTDPYNRSTVSTAYTTRGTVKDVTGSYGTLVASVGRDPDGAVNQIQYGDIAHTTTTFGYDQRRRLSSILTDRGIPSNWSSPPANYQPPPDLNPNDPTTFQRVLQHEEIDYDVVSNPTEIRDRRDPDDWPDRAKPVTRKMWYDDLYRLTRIDYEHAGGQDSWRSPFHAENTGMEDPRRADPAPHIEFPDRTTRQTFEYDWLGNTSRTDDDAGGFYDRSLGAITNGTPNAQPYQLKSATNTDVADAASTGLLSTVYDAAGNLTRLSVRRNGTTCLPSGSLCSQRYAYDWDEVGRLVRARRWDYAAASVPPASDPLPGAAVADLRYAYNSADSRVLKSAEGLSHTVYVFGSLELRRAAFGGSPADYTRSEWTEVPYLQAHGVRLARAVYDQPTVPSIGGARLHVLFELGDHLGSTSVVLDKATSELVERSSFYAYGGTDTDYRPERWKGFREDYRFTGKEEDVEVGLLYFGKRFYAPGLGRWVSSDPLSVHVPGEADTNVYAYVRGAALKATDPIGLEEDEKNQMSFTATQTDATTGLASDGSGNMDVPAPRADPRDSAPSGQSTGTGPSRLAGSSAAQLRDAVLREQYKQTIGKVSHLAQYQVEMERVGGDPAAATQAAKDAFEARQSVRGETQKLLSPGGRAVSRAFEQERTWESIQEKYGSRPNPNDEIARAAGRSRTTMTRVSRGLGALSAVGTGAGVALAANEVMHAPLEDRPGVAAANVGPLGGGIAGSVIGGAIGGGLVTWGAGALGIASGPPGWLVLGAVVVGGAIGGFGGSEIGAGLTPYPR